MSASEAKERRLQRERAIRAAYESRAAAIEAVRPPDPSKVDQEHPERVARAPERRQKELARAAVNNALRDGRLHRQPCARCGSRGRVEAHHRDYARALDVEWLCEACHDNVTIERDNLS